jgi:hypothetical protein
MSNILKGILNESNPFYGHNDPAKEYGADAPTYRKRGPYSHTDDDDGNPFAEYERQQRDFAIGRAKKQAAEKQQRDSDHDRLATGTNEGVRDLGYDAQSLIMKLRRDVEEKRLQPTRQAVLTAARELAGDMNFAPELLVQQVLGQRIEESLDDPWGDQGNFAGDKPVNVGNVSMKNIQVGDSVKYLGQSAKIIGMSKDRKYSRITISKGMGTVTQDVLTSDLQQLGRGVNEEHLNEISNEKLAQYKTAAALDAGKADSEGDYKRGDKRFSGIVKATKKQFANDTKKSAISQGINEFSPGATGPKGPKDYGQPNSSRYIGGSKFVVGTTNNYVLTATIDKWGLEWDEDDEVWFLDSPGAAHIADASEGEIELPPPMEQRKQIHDLVTDYLNNKNLADLQKVAAYYGHSDDGEMATNEEYRPTAVQANNIRKQTAQKMNPNGSKFVWKRPNQISGSHTEQELLSMGFRKSTKHNVWGGTQDMWNRISGSLDENLGDQLKSTSLDALIQAKLAIEKQREADIEAWRQDFEKNTVQKAQHGLRREFEPTPVSQPGEKHSVLKNRLMQLNSAIEKQEIVDKLVDRLERKGLMTPAIENDTDTRMHVKYGAKDNYQSLNQKLDIAINMLKHRLAMRKISGLKETNNMVEEKKPDFMKAGNMKPFKVSGEEIPGAVHTLEKALLKAKERNIKLNYNNIDKIMQAVCKKHHLTGDELHNEFVEKNHMIPDNWIVKQLNEACWKGYHKEGNKKMFGKTYPNCVKNKTSNEDIEEDNARIARKPGQPANSKKHSDLYTDENPKGTITGLKFATEEDAKASVSKIRNSGRSHAHKIQAAVAMEQRARAAGKASAAKVYRDYINSVKKTNEEQLDEKCWDTHKQVGMKNKGGKMVPNCVPKEGVAEEQHSCPHCGGEMVSEELMNEKKDACYYKVKSRYKVWPSAYASGALVKCRNKGASNWGNGGKKNESSILEGIEQADESLHDWFNKEKWVRMDTKGNIKGPCAREPGEGKPKCLPQSKAHNLGKKGRASAAQRKRREDPNPERHGKAINVNTKKKANEEALDEKWSQKYKSSINCSNPKGFSQKAHCAGKKK